ncbi:MAG TPA: HAD family hydrolase [Longimicrobium sp.]
MGAGWELVIFDCDGVLVDSEPIANRVFSAMLGEVGLPMDYDETVRTFVGRSAATCVRMVESRIGRPVPEGWVDAWRQRTLDAFSRELRAVECVAEALDRIAAPFCVASSGEPAKMRFTLGMTGLLPRFEGRMFSAVEVPRGKPAPDLFLHAARTLGAAPARCAVVEDSAVGVQAGAAAGMTVFGYAAMTDADALRAAGAAHVFTRMEELPELLARAGGVSRAGAAPRPAGAP